MSAFGCQLNRSTANCQCRSASSCRNLVGLKNGGHVDLKQRLRTCDVG